VHGIFDEDLADCPTFKEIAPEFAKVLEGSDLVG
jgi:DNA polymerase-3 subunit epsilon